MNAVITILSVMLALLLLQHDPQYFLYYLLLTIIMAAIVLTLRARLPPLRISEPTRENLFESKKWTEKWGGPILMFIVLISLFILPLLLAEVLDPYVWFTLLVGVTTGFSMAEILFYLYIRFQ